MLRFEDIQLDDALPERLRETSVVQQFLYNAALWNAHRIHYDTPWARDVEGYPELVVAGPLMGDWMTQCVLSWLGSAGRLTTLEYRNRAAAYVGETLRVGGHVSAMEPDQRCVTLTLDVRNDRDEVLVEGQAVVAFEAGA